MNDYTHLTIYQQRAIATRARRDAAGKYVTAAQKAAAMRLALRNGYKNLTVADAKTLLEHPFMSSRQIEDFKAVIAKAAAQ